MTKKFDRPYARYDAQFWQDDRYLAMPKSIRNDAYLYMLALIGYCRAKRGDGEMTASVVLGVARFMELPSRRVLAALVDAGLLVTSPSGGYSIPKYSKWQDTPDEIADLSAKRLDAINKRWTRERLPDPKGDPPTDTNGDTKRIQLANKRHTEREREVEREKRVSLVSNVSTNTPEAEAICQAFEGLGGVITPLVLQDAEGLVAEFRVPTADEFVAAIQQGMNGRTIKSLTYFRQRFRELNDSLRDAGRKHRDHDHGPRVDGLASVGAAQ